MNQFFPSTGYGNSHKDTQKIYNMSSEEERRIEFSANAAI